MSKVRDQLAAWASTTPTTQLDEFAPLAQRFERLTMAASTGLATHDARMARCRQISDDLKTLLSEIGDTITSVTGLQRGVLGQTNSMLRHFPYGGGNAIAQNCTLLVRSNTTDTGKPVSFECGFVIECGADGSVLIRAAYVLSTESNAFHPIMSFERSFAIASPSEFTELDGLMADLRSHLSEALLALAAAMEETPLPVKAS